MSLLSQFPELIQLRSMLPSENPGFLGDKASDTEREQTKRNGRKGKGPPEASTYISDKSICVVETNFVENKDTLGHGRRVQRPTSGYLFLNSTGSAQIPDPRQKELVRRHVMKHAIRSRRSQNAINGKEVSGFQRTGPNELSFEALLHPQAAVSSYPFKVESKWSPLIDFYTNYITLSFCPLAPALAFNPMHRLWISAAMNDEILFHTMLLTSALCWPEAIQDLSLSEEALRGATLRLLRSRLQSKHDVSDATIAAVSCLGTLDALQGSRQGWETHMNGLVELIRRRGGVKTLDTLVRWKVIACDTNSAANYLAKPFLQGTDISWPSAFIPPAPSSQSDIQQSALASASISKGLMEIYRLLLDLSVALEPALTGKAPALDVTACMDAFEYLQRALIMSPTSRAPIEEAARDAAMIYARCLLKGPGTVKHLLVAKLIRSLESISDEPETLTFRIWAFFVAAITSEKRLWIRKALRSNSLLAGVLRNWDSCKQHLASILWVPKALEKPCRDAWLDLNPLERQNSPSPAAVDDLSNANAIPAKIFQKSIFEQ